MNKDIDSDNLLVRNTKVETMKLSCDLDVVRQLIGQSMKCFGALFHRHFIGYVKAYTNSIIISKDLSNSVKGKGAIYIHKEDGDVHKMTAFKT